jgi:cytochrome b6-f complex iron-sulfur subunit
VDRREFLILSGSCVASGCALLSGGASHRTWKPAASVPAGSALTVPLSEVQGLGVDEALLLAPGGEWPELLVAKRPEGYVVVTADCTHAGCTVAWRGSLSEWVCPCHGSRFAVDGKVLEGPAEEPLGTPRVKVEADHLAIELG